jgi:hypothetical protein
VAGAGGLANILLNALIGLLFATGAIPLAIHGLATRKPRRGFITSIIALVLSTLSVLLSAPIWSVLLSGRGTHGEPLDYGEMSPAIVLVVIEAIAVLVSIPSAARQVLRRMS